MAELSKKFSLLLFANILWGIIPWPAESLFATNSIFIVLFIRFFLTSILILITAIIFQYNINRQSKQKILQLKFSHFKQYLFTKNRDFWNTPQWFYLVISAMIGYNGMLLLFFYGLKVLGAIVTSIGFLIGLFGCTLINWGLGKEGMSNLKALYLFTLLVGSVILGIVSQVQEDLSGAGHVLSLEGIMITILYGVTYAFFLISSDADRMSNNEITIKRIEPTYEILRIFWKTGVIMFIAALILIPQLALMQYLPLPSEILLEIQKFFGELPVWYKIAVNPNMIILTFVCTLAPFLLYYLLAATWPKNSSFDLWAGILSIIEPIVNMILGVTVLDEEFPISWLIVVILLMGIAIIMRYLGETDTQINAVLLIKLKYNNDKGAMIHAYRMKGVKRVKFLLGTWDLMLIIQTSSQRALNKLVNEELHKMPGLLEHKLLYILETNLDYTYPETWGISSIIPKPSKNESVLKNSTHGEKKW